MKKNVLCLLGLFLAGLTLFSCSKDDKGGGSAIDTESPVSIHLNISDKTIVPDHIQLEVLNTETGQKKDFKYAEQISSLKISLLPGVYTFTVSATSNTGTKVFNLIGKKENVSIVKGENAVTLDLLLQKSSSGFVFKEMAYAGFTENETNKAYIWASYFIIHNNSTETLYADSLVFGVSAGNTKLPSVNENIVKRLPAVGASSLLMIPGNGKSVAVGPGKDLVVALLAKNHHSVSDNAPDLSGADFEWGENTEVYPLEDNPQVPNLVSLHKESRSFTMLHMRGLTSYFIFKLDRPYKEFLKTFGHEDKYPNPTVPPVMRPYIPDSMILDGIEQSDGETIVQKVLPSSVDLTHTFISEMGKGLTIQRKIASKVGDIVILQDTNDSMNDFLRDQPSSLLKK